MFRELNLSCVFWRYSRIELINSKILKKLTKIWNFFILAFQNQTNGYSEGQWTGLVHRITFDSYLFTQMLIRTSSVIKLTDHIENLHRVTELELLDPHRYWEISYATISVTKVDCSPCSKQLSSLTPTVWACFIVRYCNVCVIYRDRYLILLNGFYYPYTRV